LNIDYLRSVATRWMKLGEYTGTDGELQSAVEAIVNKML
jgi:hypothetical protein